MRIGIFADAHDHLQNIRLAVQRFNDWDCDWVVFAGDLVSTFAVPPLRRLKCRLVFSYGDNEGNKVGIRGGMSVIGEVAEPPFCFQIEDGTRLLVTHQFELVRGLADGSDVIIYAHTHRARIHYDRQGRLLINPGEVSGWSFGQSTIVLLETDCMEAQLIKLSVK